MIITQCQNAFNNEIITKRYLECCVEISNLLNDHYASNNFVPLFAWAYMHAMLGIDLKKHSRLLQKPTPRRQEERPHSYQASKTTSTWTSPTWWRRWPFMNSQHSTSACPRTRIRAASCPCKNNQPSWPKERNPSCNVYVAIDVHNGSDNVDEDPNVDDNEDFNKIIDDIAESDGKVVGCPMHTRLVFRPANKLSRTHHTYCVAKMHVPYQVGWHYLSLPKKCNAKDKGFPEEPCLQYMLSIFQSWSATMNNTCRVGATWWSTL